jgi:hypothetical protein
MARARAAVRKDGIKACGAAQPVPEGIARRPRLALGRFRTTAAAAVPAARFASGFTDHAGSGAAALPIHLADTAPATRISYGG